MVIVILPTLKWHVIFFPQCHAVHRTIVDLFKYALVWVSVVGSSQGCLHTTLQNGGWVSYQLIHP